MCSPLHSNQTRTRSTAQVLELVVPLLRRATSGPETCLYNLAAPCLPTKRTHDPPRRFWSWWCCCSGEQRVVLRLACTVCSPLPSNQTHTQSTAQVLELVVLLLRRAVGGPKARANPEDGKLNSWKRPLSQAEWDKHRRTFPVLLSKVCVCVCKRSCVCAWLYVCVLRVL